VGIENAIAVVLKDNDLISVLLSQFSSPASGALPLEQAVSQRGSVLGGDQRFGVRRQGEVTGQMGG